MVMKVLNDFSNITVMALLYTLLAFISPDMTFAAHYPLEIINIKPAGTGSPAIGSTNRIFKAYPGLEYNIRVAVVGGLYPYTFTLSNAPSGMTINSSTGEISWTNPQADANNITITVRDSESKNTSATWSIDVSSSGFIFVDSKYSGTGNGTIVAPYRSISDILNLGSGFRDYIVYFRGGSYTLPAYNGVVTEWDKTRGCFLGFDGGRPYKWIGYPGESVIINMNENRVELSASMNNDAYFDSLKINNMVGYGIIASSGVDYFTIRRCDFSGIKAPLDVNGNWGMVYHNHDGGTGYNKVFQDSKFHDYRGAAALGSFYYSSKILIEDCDFYDQFQGSGGGIKTAIAPKAFLSYVFIRHNKFYNIYYGFCIGHATNSSLMDSHDIEISFNLFNASVAHNAFNTHSSTGTLYYYRNTTTGQILFQNSGPFTLEKNIIQNSTGSVGLSGVSFTEIDNLKGTSGIVDSNGMLTPSYQSKVGIYGCQLGSPDTIPPVAPRSVTVTIM